MTGPHVRLAVVSDSVYPYHKGGKELRYRELLSRLPERGIEVDLYTMKWWDDEPPDGRVRLHAIAPKIEMYAHGRRTIWQAAAFGISCLRLLVRARPSVLEADHMPYLQLFPLRLVAWRHRVPLVVTWHEVWGRAVWSSYLGPVGGTIAALIERMAMRLPNHIIAVAEGTAARLVSSGVDPRHITVIYAGISAKDIRGAAADSSAPEIISLGRLIAHKRHDLVIEAFALIRAQGVPVRLGIIGDGPERLSLELLAESLGVRDEVIFYGALPQDRQVWALLRGARVLAAPTEREGFGIAIAEALAAGLAVITTTHAGNEGRHLVEDGITGSLITPGDSEELAEATMGWMCDLGDVDARANDFERRHPQLSWNVAANAYSQLIRELAA